MSLLASLGLDDVSADPNQIPDGKYDGVVLNSEFVLVESKGTLAHAITYAVEGVDYNGAQKQQWYTLYNEVKAADGSFPTKTEDVKAGKPALSDTQKSYYKKLWVDLTGIPEEEVKNQDPSRLKGIKVTFGLKTKNGYQNVNFVEAREPAVASEVGIDVGMGIATPEVPQGDEPPF